MTAGSPFRITAALCRSVTSICDTCARHVRPAAHRGNEPRRQLSAGSVHRRPVVVRRCGEAVDDRQIQIGVLRAVLVDDHAALVDEIGLAVDSPDADRLPFEDRRLPPSRAACAAAPRRAPTATASRAAARLESVANRLSPRRPFKTASTSPLDNRSLPRTTISFTVPRCAHRRAASIYGVRQHDDSGDRAPPDHVASGRAVEARASRRLDVRAPETSIRRGGHAAHAGPPAPFQRLHQPIGTSRSSRRPASSRRRQAARAATSSRRSVLEPRHDLDRAGRSAAHRRRQRLERHAGNRVLAGA